MRKFLTAGVIGVALAYFLDPKSGKQRRNMALDKIGSKAGRAVNQAGNQAQNVSQQATGAVKQRGSSPPDNPNPDDKTLTDRVESQVFANTEFGREHLNINTVDGVVYVRGELHTQDQINQVVSEIKGVANVKGVENYLHLPGTPAPNKESALDASS